tara:strand:+ start:11440 stop:12204 length:765 start_codon:yes stop_codon:yes gene_type:complete
VIPVASCNPRTSVIETWRKITTWGADPAFNMGLDEALLEAGEAPTLRLYSWRPDTLSLGYFQKVADVPGVDKAGMVVRRITGGGAIHHARELTFSLTCDASHPIYKGPIKDSYERVHVAIQEALADFGIESTLRTDASLDSDVSGTGMCFHHSTPLDIVWSNKKGVGSAQRRRGGRVLHHGSIKLDTTPLEGNIATARSVGGPERPDALAPHLTRALSKAFNIHFEPAAPSPDERVAAQTRGPRYLHPDWVNKR